MQWTYVSFALIHQYVQRQIHVFLWLHWINDLKCQVGNANIFTEYFFSKQLSMWKVNTASTMMMYPYIHSLWPSDAIWWHRSVSILAQGMACCMTAPSHYLNQCWPTTNEVLWHSFEGDICLNTHDINPQIMCEIYTFEITSIISQGTLS